MRAWRAPILIALVASIAGVDAGEVVTREGRVAGDVTIDGAGVTIADRTIALDDVWYLRVGGDGANDVVRRSEPHAIRLHNGEVWPARLVSLQGGKCVLQATVLGQKEVDVGRIAALDFAPNTPSGGGETRGSDRVGRLYRGSGRPLPGKLLWIDASVVAVSSPFGVVKVAREELQRYVFAAGKTAAPDATYDEVGLVDGSLFVGEVSIDADGTSTEHGSTLRIRHAILGEVRVPISRLRTLVRHRPERLDLTRRAASVRRHALLSDAVEQLTERDIAVAPSLTRRIGATRALRLPARIDARYAMPAGGAAKLRGLLAPAPGSRGDVTVVVRVGEARVLERTVGPETGAEWLEIDLPATAGGAGAELVVELGLGRRCLFPSAVVFADAHLSGVPSDAEPKGEGG